MAVIDQGRDVSEALVFITGVAAIAPVAQANVIAESALGGSTLAVPAGFEYLGLRTADGGPETAVEAGEAIEFLEQGYEISGDGSITVKMTLAQSNAITRKLTRGTAPDANGVIKVKETTPSAQHILYLEGIYKTGEAGKRVVRREIGVARVSEVAYQKDERNSIKGTEVTFKWMPNELFEGAYFWEAQFDASGAVAPDPETP